MAAREGLASETDGQMVGWSQAGDPAAFVDLFWRHGPAVHAYLSRRTSRQEADDLLGEVWLRAVKSRASYDHRWPDARPWLYGIARHVLRAHWRRAGRPVGLPAETTGPDPWADADSRLDAATQRATLRRLLSSLSDDERDVLLLVTWEQLTPAEAALALGIPQGTARSRLHRALWMLRGEMGVERIPRSHPKETR